jgi:hypothetical protein
VPTVTRQFLALVIAAAAGSVTAASQAPAPTACTEWHACRELALAAAERGEYETFHDLAWRAVQTGPPKDASLMYLLARAQALSGRPHDALVMLQRLAEMGIAADASGDEFSRTRQLPGWPDVEARISAAAGGGPPASSPTRAPAGAPTAPAAPSSTPPVAAASSAAVVKPTAASSLAVVTLAPSAPVRFSAKHFAIGGVAYDAVSGRFVLGDRVERRLVVVDDRSNYTVDLVRADSAGFLDISAVEIDAKRGDLWVASAAPAEGPATLHKLQLISGRPLRAFRAAMDLEPVKLVDLAVNPSGTVLVLDARTPQLLALRPGGMALERIARLEVPDPVSVAAGSDDTAAFVAHRDGLARVDLRASSVSPVAAPKGVSLAAIERLRRYGNALIAVQTEPDGTRQIIRLDMNARGTAVTRAVRLEVSAPPAGPTFVTISGNELVYLTDNAGRSSPGDPPPDQTDYVAYRVPLR